jgi:hypothetical protein
MVSGLWTNDVDTLAEALVGYLAGIRSLSEGTKNVEPAARFWAPRAAADLIDQRAVRVLDPDDTELVESIAKAMAGARPGSPPWQLLVPEIQEIHRVEARAAIVALRQP